ncbi:MAG: PTS sugar transporter subunit IIA [Candidatus Thermoplasmatota archaeon]|nr:PTS sugar transporter subunit IIA [Candidatus Thermoplasmatota archaeon]
MIDVFPIIIVTHGKFAKALIETSAMIAGKQEKLYAVELEEGQSPESLKERIDALLTEKSLILTDLFGASPFNASIKLLDRAEVVTGVNLPMLLELLMNRSIGVEEAAAIAERAGREGIVNVRAKLSGGSKDS